jgi:sulfatase modifying factor 1
MQGKFAFFCFLFMAANVVAAETPGISLKDSQDVRSVKLSEGRNMVPYTVKLADGVSFEMIPIPGGKFKLGSPANEKGRSADEGPQVEVEIEPFWLGRCEVTWAEYQLFMKYYDIFQAPNGSQTVPVTDKNRVDAVTAPTPLHEPSHTYKSGDQPKRPAVTMSQFAARQYTKWVSKLTGQTFRLPNEAEWEYACRAGTTTAYSFGDDPKRLDDYAWTVKNSDGKTQPVGMKKPNPWGLYDMHGNVMEWTLDAYAKQGYKHLTGKQPGRGLALTLWPTEQFPRVLRGGTFEFDAELARSAARVASDDDKWYDCDPQTPKSPWWLTDDPSRAVGMRIIRLLKEMSSAECQKAWEVDNQTTKHQVESKLEDKRGIQGVVVPHPRE